MGALANAMVAIILQYVSASNQHSAHLGLIQCHMVNYIQINVCVGETHCSEGHIKGTWADRKYTAMMSNAAATSHMLCSCTSHT